MPEAMQQQHQWARKLQMGCYEKDKEQAKSCKSWKISAIGRKEKWFVRLWLQTMLLVCLFLI